MISLASYKTRADCVVRCKAGVYARGTNGQRVVYDDEDHSYHDTDIPSRFVKKKLCEPMYAPIFSKATNKVIFAIAKATQVSRSGLDWKVVFQATFFKNNDRPKFEGVEDLSYWFIGKGSNRFDDPWLLEKGVTKVKREDIVSVYIESCKYLGLEPYDIWRHHMDKLEKWNCWGMSFINRRDLLRKRKFGVEIEFTGMTRKTAADVVAKYFQTETVFSIAYQVKDRKNRIWKIVSDGSIRAESKKDEVVDSHFKCELVTPILRYSDIEILQELCRRLRKAGAKSDAERGCGVHIHIGANGHTPKSLRNLANIMAAHEELLVDALKLDRNSNRYGHYCKPVNPDFLEELNRKKPRTMAQLADVWYRGNGANLNRNQHYNDSRYHMLNLHATFTKGTIEFRLFQFDKPADGRQNGIHAGQLKSYIQLCLALSEMAKEVKSASPRPQQTENPKFAMRTWLMRLGFIGEEFATARDFLTRNLTGDAAFRNGRAA